MSRSQVKRCIKIPFSLPVFVSVLVSVLVGQSKAQTYTTLYSFSPTSSDNFTNRDGSCPRSGLILSGTALYGTTQCGGTFANGTIFRINIDGTGFTNLYTFTALTNSTNSDGAQPVAGLVLSGNTLYGTAYEGGASGVGTIFKLSTNGTDFVTLQHFSPQPDGGHPQAPLTLSDTTLYGTATDGGSSGNGTIFRVNTDGSSFTNLHSFTGANSEGANPYAGLILSGSTLYGTTLYGGGTNNGTVYKINTDGNSFVTLHSFAWIESGRPKASLILSGNILYGTTSDYIYQGNGSVFAVNTDGTGFTVLHNFGQNVDETNPWAALILSDETLYGTASNILIEWGTVFALNRDGTDFRTLHHFTGCVQVQIPGCSPDGAMPLAPLILVSNTLYGTTFGGGSSGWGTVFRVVILPRLKITPAQQSIVLTWPTNAVGYTLQSTTNLSSPVWITNLPPPVIVNSQNTVTNPISGTQQFFRLSQ